MNLRINLLEESEIERPGAGGRRLALRLSIAGAAALILLLVLVFVGRRAAIQAHLAKTQRAWEQREPAYQEIRRKQQDLESLAVPLRELEGWHASRIPWSEPLIELQEIVPSNIRFRRLSISGSVDLFKPETPPALLRRPPVGANVPVQPPPGQEEPSLKKPARRFRLQLDGVAVGDRAEEIVVQFVRDLRQGAVLQDLLRSINLQGLKRVSRAYGEEQQSMRLFGIEAMTPPRSIEENGLGVSH